MIRLLCFFAVALVGSLLCVAFIKAIVVFMAEVFYRGGHQWGYEDVRFVLIRGFLMGGAFCFLGLIRWIQARGHFQ